MAVQYNYDILNKIFSWITDVRDILNLTRVCVDFYRAIYSSVVIIYTCPRKDLPSTFILKFPYLRYISPVVIVKAEEELMSLVKWLEYGVFDLVFTKDRPGDHLGKAVAFVTEQSKYQTKYCFYFGHTGHTNYSFNLMISQDSICYVGDEENLVMTSAKHLASKSLFLSFLPHQLPNSVDKFTYIVGHHEQEIPRLDTYLERGRFAILARDTDLASPSVTGYTRFGRNFRNYFTLRKYPHLKELDVPLSLQTLDVIRQHGCFPNLEILGLLLEIITDEDAVKRYLERHHLELPHTIIIYATREDARYRAKQWKIPSLKIIVRYLAGIEDLERYV